MYQHGVKLCGVGVSVCDQLRAEKAGVICSLFLYVRMEPFGTLAYLC